MAAEYPEKIIVTRPRIDMERGSGYVIPLDKAVVLHMKKYVD